MPGNTTRPSILSALVVAAALITPVVASAQDVTIVYPIDGGTYPITNPPPAALSSADVIGSATFYDQVSEQQVWKLPGGEHTFWVSAGRTCGRDRVKFWIGN